MDGHTVQRRVRTETARRADQVEEVLPRLELIDCGSDDCTRDLGPSAVDGNEHHIPRLEPDVAPRVPMQ